MSLKTVKEHVCLARSGIHGTLPLYFTKDNVTIKIIEVTKRIVFFKKCDCNGYGMNRDIEYEWEEIDKFINEYGEYIVTHNKINISFM